MIMKPAKKRAIKLPRTNFCDLDLAPRLLVTRELDAAGGGCVPEGTEDEATQTRCVRGPS
jgi:hypothetical protein